MTFKGIHHVSAITADAQGNLNFYREVLGLRLVKKTVNQDQPSMYHLFYGDEKGNPGTELTFFEIPLAGRTHRGNNSISLTSLRVPNDAALDYWMNRFDEKGVAHEDIKERAGRLTLGFTDFEDQRLMLVSDESDKGVAGGVSWSESPVPSEVGIVGLGPSQLTTGNIAASTKFMVDVLGFREKGSYESDVENQPDILVFETGLGGSGAEIHLEERLDLPPERSGRGSVHHIALRVEDERELYEWIENLNALGVGNSGFVDRFYFRSVYLTDPNGITLEIATDGPGFATDEALESLGENLSLPPFLEDRREIIEKQLVPIE